MHDITGKGLGKSEAGIAHSIKIPLKRHLRGMYYHIIIIYGITYIAILVNVLPSD